MSELPALANKLAIELAKKPAVRSAAIAASEGVGVKVIEAAEQAMTAREREIAERVESFPQHPPRAWRDRFAHGFRSGAAPVGASAP
jgi:hypothetical protein